MFKSIRTWLIDLVPKRGSGLYSLAWIRLKRNNKAMVGLVFILLIAMAALFAGVLFPEGYDNQNMDTTLLPPSLEHICGTDNLGRDIFTRLVYGARVSFQIGFVTVGVSAVVGVVIGSIAGYFGGIFDMLIMRFLDIFQSIPGLLLAMAIAAALGSGIINAMIAIGITMIPTYARLVRGSILALRDVEYVDAAKAVTASDARILFKHLLPNVLSPVLVTATLNFASSIIVAAMLSFIGLGAQAPLPEWGAMITSSRAYIRDYWWTVSFPGLAIMLTVISFNMFGDGVRDALDPRMKY